MYVYFQNTDFNESRLSLFWMEFN